MSFSLEEQLHEHCKLTDKEIDKRNGELNVERPVESTRRQVAQRILVAAGRGHKELPHLPIPHVPGRHVLVPDITAVLRRPKLKLHRPDLKTLRFHKAEMKLRKPKVQLHGPKQFRYADAFDPEYSLNRTYVRNQPLRIIRRKASKVLPPTDNKAEKDNWTVEQTPREDPAANPPASQGVEDFDFDFSPTTESTDSQNPFDSNDLDCDECPDGDCSATHETEHKDKESQLGAGECGKKEREDVYRNIYQTVDKTVDLFWKL